MNLHRLDLVSLLLFNLIARTGSISQGARLANMALGAASRRTTDLEAALETDAARAPFEDREGQAAAWTCIRCRVISRRYGSGRWRVRPGGGRGPAP